MRWQDKLYKGYLDAKLSTSQSAVLSEMRFWRPSYIDANFTQEEKEMPLDKFDNNRLILVCSSELILGNITF
jgi:hypothetical protein